jgi:hypothetical protein
MFTIESDHPMNAERRTRDLLWKMLGIAEPEIDAAIPRARRSFGPDWIALRVAQRRPAGGTGAFVES